MEVSVRRPRWRPERPRIDPGWIDRETMRKIRAIHAGAPCAGCGEPVQRTGGETVNREPVCPECCKRATHE